MDEFEKYSAEAAEIKISDYHNKLFQQYLNKQITVHDIAELLNAKEEHEFWEEFREKYSQAGEDPTQMLEELKREAANSAGKTRSPADDGNGDRTRPDHGVGGSPTVPVDKREKKPLPEPEIPRDRRGRDRKESSLLRVVRGIGRRIFRRH